MARRGDASRFLRGAAATVTDDGELATAVNMSWVSPGATFEVAVRHDGDTIAVADGEVVE
jgi:hypothetical protein